MPWLKALVISVRYDDVNLHFANHASRILIIFWYIIYRWKTDLINLDGRHFGWHKVEYEYIHAGWRNSKRTKSGRGSRTWQRRQTKGKKKKKQNQKKSMDWYPAFKLTYMFWYQFCFHGCVSSSEEILIPESRKFLLVECRIRAVIACGIQKRRLSWIP